MNDLAQLVPSSVVVAFTATDSGAPDPPVYAVTVTLASLSLSQYSGITGSPWAHTLHRYEVATYPGPSNSAALIAVATQMVKDWYLWQLARLDQQIDGFFDWTPEGMHDIEWRQARGRITTRVIRGPFNPQEDLIVPLPVMKGSDCAIRDRTTCIAGWEVRQVSYDCGNSWTTVENLGHPCGEDMPCRSIFPTITNTLPGPCILGTQYFYYQTIQFQYDTRGCLQMTASPQVLTAVGCCVVCGSGSGPQTGVNTGSAGICPGLTCGFCTGATPCQWTFALSGGTIAGSCKRCSGGTPTKWTKTGDGFTNDFSSFNGSIDLFYADGCEWMYDPGGTGIYTLGIQKLAPYGVRVVSMFIANDGVTSATYFGPWTAGTTLDCCSAVTLTLDKQNGSGTCPTNITVTPTGCSEVSCTPDPSGSWSVTQTTKTCTWAQFKSGVSGVLSLNFNPILNQFTLELVVTGAEYTLVFLYISGPGQASFLCSTNYTLQLVSQEGCMYSDTPLSVVVTPVMSAAACCTGGGGGSSATGTGGGSGGTGGGSCCGCTITPTNWMITVAGIANGSCTVCANYNGTFTLSPSGTACTWKSARRAGCASPASPPLGGWTLTCDGTNWLLVPDDMLSSEEAVIYAAPVAEWNCLGSNVMALTGSTPSCGSFPATITVSPG